MTDLSVCMATHDGERFLRQQLDSIVPQLGPDDELVVSDDSSTDGTLAIVKAYHDPRIRLVHRAGHPDPVRNFELALRHAAGAVIVLSDQDDVWLDNKLAVVRRQFDRRSGAAHLLMLDGQIVAEDGSTELASSIIRATNAGPGLVKNIYDNTYRGCCLAFNRPLLDVALPFPGRLPMHDMWLGLLAEMFGTVAFVRQPTIRHRRHAMNASPLALRLDVPRQLSRRYQLLRCLLVRCWERKVWRGWGRRAEG